MNKKVAIITLGWKEYTTKYLEDWRADPNRSAISNEGRDWGSEKLVIERVESKETN